MVNIENVCIGEMTKTKTKSNFGPVKLKYAKTVRPQQRSQRKGYATDTVGLRSTKRTSKGGVTLPRPIQLYRHYFLYLKLALELESLDYCFREIQRTEIKKKGKSLVAGKRVKDRPLIERVRVNRKEYEGWNLDSVREDSFDKWWKDHSEMFIDQPTEEIVTGDQVVESDHCRYFKIDSRRSITDTVNEIKSHLSRDKQRRSTNLAKWNITGEMREEALFNRYNALIMYIEGMSSPDILSSKLFRVSRNSDFLIKHGHFGDPQKNSQRMRSLLQPARRIVLSVCDGYFMKSPKWDDYFTRRRR